MTFEPRGPECPDAEQLAAFADGGLPAGQRQRIEAHLAECDDCYEAVVEIAAITAQIVSPAAPADPSTLSGPHARRSIFWIGGAVAAAAAIFVLLNVWAGTRPDALELAVTTLAQAHRGARFGLGRLSVDRTWAPESPVLRSGNSGADALDELDVRSAAQALKVLAASDHSRRGFHAYGLALVASRDYDAAIEAFTQALLQPASNDAVIHADLSALWLERHRLSGQAADAERALAEADRALSTAPQHLHAAFNRALALDVLARPEARRAWQAYIDLDRNAADGWIAEATRRRDSQR